MAASPPATQGRGRGGRRYTRLFVRAWSIPVALGALVGLDFLLALLVWEYSAGGTQLLALFGLVFAVPTLIAAFATPPFASALGGKFGLQRSLFLLVTTQMLVVPIALIARIIPGLLLAVPDWVPVTLLFLQAPTLWWRHTSLYGISRPSHLRSLPVALLQPVLAVLGVFALFPPNGVLIAEAILFLGIGFACAVLLIRASDRPLRREFGVSGLSLIRPFLDHITGRDPGATTVLEAFFSRFASPADLRVSLLRFVGTAGTKATIALPTVHPGPFAALGASDLPRKVAESLPAEAGVVFVPHTPCDHDLDLPSHAEVDRMLGAMAGLAAGMVAGETVRASPLVGSREGSMARAQVLGPARLVVISQAPEPSDDIAFAVVDPIYRRWRQDNAEGEILFIDAHNSFAEGKGDLPYASPGASRLTDDIRAALTAAQAATVPGPVEVGVSTRIGYTIGEHGIGPQGVRAMVVRAAGRTAAYVLIDGNNLVQGMRAPILDRLRDVVDDAEVMTTDNHVVHEVDGSVNAVGQRYPAEQLAGDVRAVVEAAKADLTPVAVAVGTEFVPGVPVLGPGFTDRLLTSLGDTVAAFYSAAVLTFLLLTAASLSVALGFGVP